MSASIRALKRRIRTVSNTGKMAKAMKAISVSKLRQTEQAVKSWTRYIDALDSSMRRLVLSGKAQDHPLLHPRESEEPLIAVVVASDRGLCGSYNMRVLDHADRFLRSFEEIKVVPLGRKAIRHFTRSGRHPFLFSKEHSGRPDIGLSNELCDLLLDEFMSGRCNKAVFIFSHYVNALKFVPVHRVLLPVSLETFGPSLSAAQQKNDEEKVIFEPDPREIAMALFKRWLRGRVHGFLCDAFTSEHAARRMAMSDAFDNCEELFYDLTLKMNKARQASITKELLEIVGGAEALRDGGGC